MPAALLKVDRNRADLYYGAPPAPAVEKGFDPKAIELRTRARLPLSEQRRLVASSGLSGTVGFVEGPPTMNGAPHAGHLRGRVIKDVWYRHQTLLGRRVRFEAGWDAQGLPVELQAQKELGISGDKSELMGRVGAEGLVAKCKELVHRYQKQWAEADDLLGVSLGREGAYWTYRDEFIEREWKVLQRGLEAGILEQDHAVVAYCPSCQTSLSHAEVSQGYEEVEDPSMYYKAKLAGQDAYLIVWTTMPFTLVTDAMIGLDPGEQYCYVRVGAERWVVGRTRLGPLMEELGLEYEVESSAPGSSFEGARYEHPLLDCVPKLAELARSPGYHVAVAEKFVDAGAGSGLVHLSPANGEEDMAAASRRGVPLFCPIDDRVRFTADAGRYAGMAVREADGAVARDLEERGALVRLGRLRHKYPLCWRSRHPVVWLARRGWFYKLDRLGDMAVRAAESVRYYYEQPRNRFLAIVRERHPWCISRERAWGTPLPAWWCSGCGKHTWLFSREQITEAAGSLPDGPDFELHVPWIDRVAVRCSSCGGPTAREPYVLDTWHNSGSAPLASLTDSEYGSLIPAPFFTEGIDQTRGWAYTLLVESVIYRGEPSAPYSSFLFQGHVLDGGGNKMSKSRGNVLDARELLSEHPADLVRFYMVWKASPIEPLNFDAREMAARPYQVLATLYHMHLYYSQNGSYDGYDGSATVAWAEEEGLLREADRWLLSRLAGAVRECGEAAEACRLHEWARAVEDFVINALSQGYVPMTRGELWDDGPRGAPRRRAIYAVLQEALRTLDVLLHPICPYTTEHLYASAFGAKPSVLLEGWPAPGPRDEKLESRFGLVFECVSAASAARMKAGLKRRWPIDSLDICLPSSDAEALAGMEGLIAAQANADSCVLHPLKCEKWEQLVMEVSGMGMGAPSAELDRKRLGPRARGHLQALLKEHEGADPSEILERVVKSGSYRYEAGGMELGERDYEFSLEAREGSALAVRGSIVAVVPSSRSPEAAARGLVRDVARRIQALRKERGYDPAEVLSSAFVLGLEKEAADSVRSMSAELASLVRVRSVELDGLCDPLKEEKIDGMPVKIGLRR